MNALSLRDRKAIIGGCILIAAAVLLLRGIPAWRSGLRESHAQVAELSAELASAEHQSRYARSLQDTLVARNRRFLELEPYLLDGSTVAAATASLAGLVSSAATAANVRAGSVQVSADSNPNRNFARITLRMQATADVRGLATMLASLERGPVLLRIGELQVNQPDPRATSDRPEIMQLGLVVHGIALLRSDKSK